MPIMYRLSTFLSLGAHIAYAAQLPRATPEAGWTMRELFPRATSITVNLGTTYQEMDGFGVSEAFGRAENIYTASATAQQAVLDYMYSPTLGAGFTILRNRIGNSNTTGDSIEPNSPGSPSSTPEYVWDGSDSDQVWLSQQALTYGVKYIYADAWGAPYFMKTNDDEGNGGYLCGVTGESCSSGSWLQAYANFLVKYVQYYSSVGVNITHLGFLNEPEYAASYSSMLSSGTQAADFIKVLYPTLVSAGLSSQVHIACCDSEGWQNQITMTAQLISAGVESELGIITSHSYTSQPDTPIATSLKVWQTEYADLNGAWNTNWYSSGIMGEGFYWAQLIYNGIINANLSAYLYWEGAETDVTTDSCLISISGNTVTPSARLWAMAQWSRYVRPGALRVATTSGSSSLLTSAFKNTDGTVSVQVLNTATSSQAISISVSGGSFSGLSAVFSDQTNLGEPTTLSATLSGGIISATVSANSMNTFILSGSGSSSGGGSTAGTTSTTSTTHSTTTTSAPSGGTQSEWGQCGGSGWIGPTACITPYTCSVLNSYYYQCV